MSLHRLLNPFSVLITITFLWQEMGWARGDLLRATAWVERNSGEAGTVAEGTALELSTEPLMMAVSASHLYDVSDFFVDRNVMGIDDILINGHIDNPYAADDYERFHHSKSIKEFCVEDSDVAIFLFPKRIFEEALARRKARKFCAGFWNERIFFCPVELMGISHIIVRDKRKRYYDWLLENEPGSRKEASLKTALSQMKASGLYAKIIGIPMIPKGADISKEIKKAIKAIPANIYQKRDEYPIPEEFPINYDDLDHELLNAALKGDASSLRQLRLESGVVIHCGPGNLNADDITDKIIKFALGNGYSRIETNHINIEAYQGYYYQRYTCDYGHLDGVIQFVARELIGNIKHNWEDHPGEIDRFNKLIVLREISRAGRRVVQLVVKDDGHGIKNVTADGNVAFDKDPSPDKRHYQGIVCTQCLSIDNGRYIMTTGGKRYCKTIDGKRVDDVGKTEGTEFIIEFWISDTANSSEQQQISVAAAPLGPPSSPTSTAALVSI